MNLAGLLDQRATEAPGRAAIIAGDGTLTYAGLLARAAGVAAALAAAGIGPGARVVVLAPMSGALYAGLLGCWRTGATVVAVDPGAGGARLAAVIARTAPAALLATPAALLLRWRFPALRRIPLAMRLGPGWSLRPRCDRDTAAQPPADLAADHPALLTATSGSTGEPKIALRSHGVLLAQHHAIADALGSRPGAVSLATLAIFALSDLAAGQTVLVPDADLRRPGAIAPGPVRRQIDAHRPEVAVASPAFLERLLPGDLSPLRRIFTGGAPVFPALLDRLAAAAPQAQVVALYGSTEAEPIAHAAREELGEAERLAMRTGGGLLAGHPVPAVDCRILAADGAPCAPGAAGEICVAGAHVLPGYLDGLGDAEHKRRIDGRIFHRTGDGGRIDADGRLWLLGRLGAVVEDRAGTLHPFAVEAAAMAVPGVRRCALLAAGGKRLLAVEAEPGADPLPRLRTELAWAALDRLVPCPIPVDRRHNAKVDYPALRRRLRL